MEFTTLLTFWFWILGLGIFLIVLRKGWLKNLISFFSAIFFQRPTNEIDLAWEVRRIRRLLEFFYFLVWLGLAITILVFINSSGG